MSNDRHLLLQSTANRRLNVGSGQHPLHYWTNIDASPNALADIVQSVPPLPFADASLDEIYAGHFVEHLTPEEADAFLQECFRCLTPNGRVGLLVPDTREVMKRYLRADIDEIEYPQGVWHPVADLDSVCRMFLYSTVQESGHKWSYDSRTLRNLLERNGFKVTRPIDRWKDPRVALGAWYQCGWDATRP